MDTRLRFKIIAILISLSLLGLLISQGYWLNRLYVSTEEQVSEQVQDALRIADYKELFIRIDNLKNIGYHGQVQRQISFSRNEENIQTAQSDTIAIDIQGDRDETLNSYLSLIGQMEGLIQGELHHKVDSLSPVNYALFDSLLIAELHQRDIYIPHKLQAIQTNLADTIVYTSSDSIQTKQSGHHLSTYQYSILPGKSYYRLYLAFPHQFVFYQMAGILISSFLLIVIILIAFVYLLHTILWQKTIEELKADFTNNMTHELKTPISVAFSANDVLLNHSTAVSDKQQKYLTIVREQLTHLSGLVEQILTLSVENRNAFRLHLEPIQISGLLPALIEQYKLKADKQLTFITEVPETVMITADRTHLYNMLSNLIENAIKYSGDKPGNISITARQHNGEICLNVSDTGIGISDVNQKKIFDKFFRVPCGNLHNAKGYGLGLYYVNDMMHKHGGFVTVKSQPDKGSTFTLHFKN